MQPDLICFSHLRWNFVYQRPQHLMTRLARTRRIFYVEEPLFDAKEGSHYHIYKEPGADVSIVVPHLTPGLNEAEIILGQRLILDSLLKYQSISQYISWYYSPMAWSFSHHLAPIHTVYDCMDELSAFLFAPPMLKKYELCVIEKADIVFTGGYSLYRAKKELHPNILPFPSSIDKKHFLLARSWENDPADQRDIPSPRIGFYGVLDERLDIGLLRDLSQQRPAWQFIMIGPVVKIEPASLPREKNIHYLGPKPYAELPQYLAGWDIAMMPFAKNASTKFISPTKTPEYLAGGKPVISPSLADVVTPYGELGLVKIADTAQDFILAAEEIFQDGAGPGWLGRVDQFLADISWDRTAREMDELIDKGIQSKKIDSPKKSKRHV